MTVGNRLRFLGVSSITLLVCVLVCVGPLRALAIYAPGETLDPSCLPSDPSCYVDTALFDTNGIELENGTTSPATTTDRLYNVGGSLYWNGSAVGGGGGSGLSTTSIDTSSELLSIIGDETGTGAIVFANAPTFTGTTNFASLLATGSSTIGGGTAQTGLTIYGGATTTGNAYFASSVGIGTSSPYAKLTIHAQNGDTATTLFAIASSTSATTSILFNVSNTGDVVAYGNVYSKGLRWTAQSAAGNNDTWKALAYGNGLFVAVGSSGDRVMTSPDGINWTTVSAAGDNDTWQGVTYGSGLFVAVSQSGDRVMTSPDGATWTVRSAAGDNDGWLSITYGEGLFVAVGYGSDVVMTSPDGVTWTARSAAGNDDVWTDVIYGNGIFVAVSENGAADSVMTSPDGITWTAQSAAGDDDGWEGITYGNGLFVAVSNFGDSVMTSPDGSLWTAYTVAGGDEGWEKITYGNGLFVAVAQNGSGSDRVMTSPDGVAWTTRSAAGDNDFWRDIVYGDGRFVAVGESGDRVMTSGALEQGQLSTNNTYQGGMQIFGNVGIGTSSPYRALSVVGTTTSTLGFNVDTNARLLSYQGSTTISVLGTRNFFAGLGANGSSTKSLGTDNVFIGQAAGIAVTSNGNVFIGSGSGQGSTTGAAMTGSDNTAVGMNTLTMNSTGMSNSAFGSYALYSNTLGSRNSAFGESALYSNLTGTYNSAFGELALWRNRSGTLNEAIGVNAMESNTSGSYNSSLGSYSLMDNTTGIRNIAIGYTSMSNNVDGDNNVAVGAFSLGHSYLAYGNTALGTFAGQNLGSYSSGNTFLGYSADSGGGTHSTSTAIGAGALVIGSNRMALGGTGINSVNIGIGTTSPLARLSIHVRPGDMASSTNIFAIASSSGNATTTLLAFSNTGLLTLNNSAGILQQQGTTTARIVGGVKDDTNLNSAHGLFVQGKYAYVVSNGDDSLRIIDIANPTAPKLLGGIKDATNLDSAAAVSVAGRYAYVVAYMDRSFHVIDVSNPAAPVEVGALKDTTNLNGAASIYVSGKYAYIITTNSGRLTIMDIANPAAPRVAGVFFDGTHLNSAFHVTVEGRYAYVASYGDNALDIIDISNPTNPIFVSSFASSTVLNSPTSVAVSGKYAYVTASMSDSLAIIDVSNPASPTFVGSAVDSSRMDYPTSVSIADKYAYVAVGTDNSLRIIDISSSTNPSIVGGVKDATNLYWPAAVVVSGKYAYVVNEGDNSLRIIDIGGIDTPAAHIGNIFTDDMNVAQSLSVTGSGYMGGLNVGPLGLSSMGAGSFLANATTSLTASPVLSAIGNDNNTSSILDILSLTHTATGTISSGIGTGLLFNTEYAGTAAASTTATSTARIAAVLTDSSASTPASALSFFTKSGISDLQERMRLSATGNLGIGSTTPTAKLAVHALAGETNTELFTVASSTVSATSTFFSIDRIGNLSAPQTLASCGGIQTNGNGTMSCTSDERLKNITNSFTKGLDAILKIEPQTYTWKEYTPLFDGNVEYSGFIAQDVKDALEEAVTTNKAGYLQVNQTTILAAVINAVKELAGKVDTIASTIAGYAQSFTTEKVNTHELCVTKTDGGEVCVTGDELERALEGRNEPASSSVAGSAEQPAVPQSDPEVPLVVEPETPAVEEISEEVDVTPTLDPVSESVPDEQTQEVSMADGTVESQ